MKKYLELHNNYNKKHTNKLFCNISAIICAVFLLTACGGGGGDGAEENKPNAQTQAPQRLLSANSLNTENYNPQHYMVNTDQGNTVKYRFKLSAGQANEDFSHYTFTRVITNNANNAFQITNSARVGNAYQVTVKYSPQTNETQTHKAQLRVSATNASNSQAISKTLTLQGQEPFNVVLHKHPETNQLNEVYNIVMAGFPILNRVNNTSQLFSTSNVTRPAQEAWFDSRPDMAGRRFIFPFNAPLIQTYNPTYAGFLNPITLKTYAVDNTEVFFVIQYKPQQQEIFNETRAKNIADNDLNTVVKYHALFSDGLPRHRPLNLPAKLLIDDVSQNITISPHDGTWSPDDNSAVIKNKVFAQESSFVLSKLTNIQGHPNKQIISVNVLLNENDFTQFYQALQNIQGDTFNANYILQNFAEMLPPVLKNAINSYRQLFIDKAISATPQPDMRAITEERQPAPPRQNTPTPDQNTSGETNIPRSNIQKDVLLELRALTEDQQGFSYSDLDRQDKGKLLAYGRSKRLLEEHAGLSQLTGDDIKALFAHLLYHSDLRNDLADLGLPPPPSYLIKFLYGYEELYSNKAKDNNALQPIKQRLLDELKDHNAIYHDYSDNPNNPRFNAAAHDYVNDLNAYHIANSAQDNIHYLNLFSEDIYQVLLQFEPPAVQAAHFRLKVTEWMPRIPLLSRHQGMSRLLGLSEVNINNPDMNIMLDQGLQNKFYFIAETVPQTIIDIRQGPEDNEAIEIFTSADNYQGLRAQLPQELCNQLPIYNAVNWYGTVANISRDLLTAAVSESNIRPRINALWENNTRGLWALSAYNTLDGCDDGKRRKMNLILANIDTEVLNRAIPGMYIPSLTILPKIAKILLAFKKNLIERTMLVVSPDIPEGREANLYKRIRLSIQLGPVISDYTKIDRVAHVGMFPADLDTGAILNLALATQNLRDQLIDFVYNHFQGGNFPEGGIREAMLTKDELLPFKFSKKAILDIMDIDLISMAYDGSPYFNDPPIPARSTAANTYKRGFAENILEVLGYLPLEEAEQNNEQAADGQANPQPQNAGLNQEQWEVLIALQNEISTVLGRETTQVEDDEREAILDNILKDRFPWITKDIFNHLLTIRAAVIGGSVEGFEFVHAFSNGNREAVNLFVPFANVIAAAVQPNNEVPVDDQVNNNPDPNPIVQPVQRILGLTPNQWGRLHQVYMFMAQAYRPCRNNNLNNGNYNNLLDLFNAVAGRYNWVTEEIFEAIRASASEFGHTTYSVNNFENPMDDDILPEERNQLERAFRPFANIIPEE